MDNSSYNKYYFLHEVSYKMIEFLMDNNENIWKLLKYNDPDAWKRPNLTKQEKASLIYKGQEDLFNYRVFMDDGQSDVWTEEVCILKISPHKVIPNNHVVGDITILAEVYSHYKINHISNYKTRVDYIIQQLIETFNGQNIGGIGRMSFNVLGSQNDRIVNGGIIPFRGKWLLMSNNVG